MDSYSKVRSFNDYLSKHYLTSLCCLDIEECFVLNHIHGAITLLLMAFFFLPRGRLGDKKKSLRMIIKVLLYSMWYMYHELYIYNNEIVFEFNDELKVLYNKIRFTILEQNCSFYKTSKRRKSFSSVILKSVTLFSHTSKLIDKNIINKDYE